MMIFRDGSLRKILFPFPLVQEMLVICMLLKKIVNPIADDFNPQLIIISAGQDASIFDPLGRMMVSAEGYRKMTKFMMQLAESNCGGKLVAVHEGGYISICTVLFSRNSRGTEWHYYRCRRSVYPCI